MSLCVCIHAPHSGISRKKNSGVCGMVKVGVRPLSDVRQVRTD